MVNFQSAPTDKDTAITKATERFIYYRSKTLNHEKIFSISATELRDAFLISIQQQVDNLQLSVGRQGAIKTFTKHYLRFVTPAVKIQNIDPKLFRTYLAFRRKSKSDILVTVCNGQVKQDTLLSRLFIKFPLILNRGLIA